jgi:hypothetical protein
MISLLGLQATTALRCCDLHLRSVANASESLGKVPTSVPHELRASPTSDATPHGVRTHESKVNQNATEFVAVGREHENGNLGGIASGIDGNLIQILKSLIEEGEEELLLRSVAPKVRVRFRDMIDLCSWLSYSLFEYMHTLIFGAHRRVLIFVRVRTGERVDGWTDHIFLQVG